ncbi:MAG: M61 family peptidase [Thermoanaerobaculia bacterium]
MSSPLHYRVRFPERRHHFVDLELTLAAAPGELELFLPVWTPGSYLVREYAKHLQDFTAHDARGGVLAGRKAAKNRWRIDLPAAGPIVVRYRLYARTLAVQSNFVDRDFALLNGAATFLVPVGSESRERIVEIERPPEWERTVSALEPMGDNPDRLRAPDHDTLVDSPIYVGGGRLHRFSAGGREHLFLDHGGEGIWDGERAAAETARIVAAELAFWATAPYRRFVFLNLVAEGSGGLEHRESTVLLTSRWRARTRKGWLEWLGLVAHEFFHAWNVKRLRPVELGPFDYEREVPTESLWIAEGITSYYDDLLVRRAGLASESEYLGLLSEQIEKLQTTAGRLAQPLAEASRDAWIKYYRQDENSPNATISYYVKGAVVAFLLDAEIRRASAGARSLDDLMRAAYARWSGERGFAAAEFEALASELAGTDLAPFFARAIRSTAELDYAPALAELGLRFRPESPAAADPERAPKGWLGTGIEARCGRLLVGELRRGSPAWEAGLEIDDEILAIEGYRVFPDAWEKRLEAFPPGSRATLLVARRERLIELEATFGGEPEKRWRLEPDPAADESAHRRRAVWLASGADSPTR